MKTVDLIYFMNLAKKNYRQMKQPSAARVCDATLKKVIAFIGRDSMSFNELSKEWLKAFEEYLKRSLADNTVSTYLRMLQAVYNKAVYEGVAKFVPHLFKKVYKGRMPSRSRALEQQDFQAVANMPKKPLADVVRTRDFFLLMFFLRGIPFVDMVHLRRSDLRGDRLTYRRRKTGKQMVVLVEAQAMEIIKRYQNSDFSTPYLFPFLVQTSKDGFQQYESALRRFNNQLKWLGALLGLSIPLTSYCARHTWASFANFCDFDKKLICESMGHSSVQVTEIYFKPHEVEEIRVMNQQVIVYAMTGN